jgi:hypothetical protein
MVGCRRGVATFPLARDTFDALFNGRSGYRAQYYLSCEDGIQFNSEIIRALTKPLALTYQKVPAEEFAVLERSFVGPYSKIWVLGDRAPFLAAQEKEYLCPGVGSRTIRSHWGCARRYPIHQRSRLRVVGLRMPITNPGRTQSGKVIATLAYLNQDMLEFSEDEQQARVGALI